MAAAFLYIQALIRETNGTYRGGGTPYETDAM